ncbi:MAG: hypothetical protein ABSH41_12410 [Syntrophobacteraceae bacterium]|jgi:hypothetical protein
MIDIWVKLVSNQFELALNLTRAAFGLGEREAPVSAPIDPATAMVPEQADAVAANPMDEPQKTGREEERLAAVVPEAETETPRKAAPISGRGAGKIPGRQIKGRTGSAQAEGATIAGIISFLESAHKGATVREVAEHLEMDKKSILPLLKTLVKERRIDELLGRYCVIKS